MPLDALRRCVIRLRLILVLILLRLRRRRGGAAGGRRRCGLTRRERRRLLSHTAGCSTSGGGGQDGQRACDARRRCSRACTARHLRRWRLCRLSVVSCRRCRCRRCGGCGGSRGRCSFVRRRVHPSRRRVNFRAVLLMTTSLVRSRLGPMTRRLLRHRARRLVVTT